MKNFIQLFFTLTLLACGGEDLSDKQSQTNSFMSCQIDGSFCAPGEVSDDYFDVMEDELITTENSSKTEIYVLTPADQHDRKVVLHVESSLRISDQDLMLISGFAGYSVSILTNDGVHLCDGDLLLVQHEPTVAKLCTVSGNVNSTIIFSFK